jgi:hypothetical protein
MKEFKFKIGGQDYAATVEDLKDGQMKVTVNGQTYQVEVPQTKAQGPRVAMAPAAPEAQKGGTKNVNSELPGTVTKIGSTAFDDQQTMTAITIPASVTSIGYAAFNSCQLLTSITLLGNSYPQASSAFTGTFSSTGTVHGQAGVDYTTFMSWLPSGWTLAQ